MEIGGEKEGGLCECMYTCILFHKCRLSVWVHSVMLVNMSAYSNYCTACARNVENVRLCKIRNRIHMRIRETE